MPDHFFVYKAPPAFGALFQVRRPATPGLDALEFRPRDVAELRDLLKRYGASGTATPPLHSEVGFQRRTLDELVSACSSLADEHAGPVCVRVRTAPLADPASA